MFDKKVIIEQLPIGGNNNLERRIFSEKGELASKYFYGVGLSAGLSLTLHHHL